MWLKEPTKENSEVQKGVGLKLKTFEPQNSDVKLRSDAILYSQPQTIIKETLKGTGETLADWTLPSLKNLQDSFSRRQTEVEESIKSNASFAGKAYEQAGQVVGGVFDIVNELPVLKTIGKTISTVIDAVSKASSDKVSSSIFSDKLGEIEKSSKLLTDRSLWLIEKARKETNPEKKQLFLDSAQSAINANNEIVGATNEISDRFGSMARKAEATVNIGTLGFGSKKISEIEGKIKNIQNTTETAKQAYNFIKQETKQPTTQTVETPVLKTFAPESEVGVSEGVSRLELKPKEQIEGQPTISEIEKAKTSGQSFDGFVSINREELVVPGVIEDTNSMRRVVKTKENAEKLKDKYLDQLINAQEDIKNEGGRQTASTNSILRERDAKTALKTLTKIEEELPTNSQLKAEWNNVPVKTKPEPVSMEQAKASGQTPRERVSKTALKTRDTALEKGIEAEFGELPEYRTMNMVDQVTKAKELIDSDLTKAKRVAMGEENPPGDLRVGTIYKAVEKHAIETGDVTTLLDLTKSRISQTFSALGQEIKALDTGIENSPVKVIKEINQLRSQKIKPEKITYETSYLKEQIKKSAPTKQNWVDFVKSLQC